MKNKRGAVAIWAGVVLVLALGVGYLIYAGFIVINTAPVKQATASTCSGEVLDKFNAAANTRVESIEDFKNRADKIGIVAAEVRDNPNHANDATCAFIVLSSALASHDSAMAKEYLGRLKSVVDEGRFVDTRASGLTSIEALQLRVDGLSADANGGGAALGSG